MRIDVTAAIATLKVGSGCSPLGWVWIFAGDVVWDGVAREKVDVDVVAGPVHRVDSSAIVVHWRAVRSFFADDAAADVTAAVVRILVAGSLLSALGRGERAGTVNILGMKRGVRLGYRREAFDDIYFAVWPFVISYCPARETLAFIF
jgi:hypothetical protein